MNTLLKNKSNMFPAVPLLLSNLLHEDWLDSTLGNLRTGMSSLPAANIRETNEDYRIELAAPGMQKEDFTVELNDEVLTISAQADVNREKEERIYTRKEFSYHAFQRSFNVARERIDAERISARYQDGVLEIIVPKREEVKAKTAKQISIQ
jgi:HSP20 family protein